MRKLCTLLLAFCLSLNVFAQSGTLEALERQLDDYQYALTVEWDQQDQSFHAARTEELFQKMGVLMAQGLKQEEIISLLERKMASKQAIEAIKLRLSVLANSKTPKELATVLSENADQFYLRGASWNGDVLPMVGIGLVIAAIVGYAIWFHANHECVATAQRWECNESCTDNYYGYSCSSSCGWRTVCTAYQKKQKN